MDEGTGPSTLTPETAPRRSLSRRLRSLRRAFTTRQGLLGDYDYGFLFRPNIPFLPKPQGSARRKSPFFGLNDRMPVFLGLLLGLQHALAMLAGIITPPLILAGSGGVNLPVEQQQYLVSTALIVSGILSSIQITRFHIYKTPYYIGTGLISVVGISFSIIPVAQGAISQMYANGFCPSDAAGNPLPCPRGYGALLGTCAVCALLEILLSFIPPRILLRMFPPIVTGPTVMLIGINLIESGFQDWMGGSGCTTQSLCPSPGAPHALPWGSAEFLGLGFSVFVTIILCERFGSPIMKSTSVIIGLLVGCIIAAACGYFDRSGIDSAPVASFIWVHTFPPDRLRPVGAARPGRLHRVPDRVHRRHHRHLRRLPPRSRRHHIRVPRPGRRPGRWPQRLSRRPHDHNAHEHLCAEQRRHRPHPLRQPQSRLCLLLLPPRHGHLCKVRRCPRRHPLIRPGRHDHVPLLLSGRLWHRNRIARRALYSPEPLHPHRRSGPRLRRNLGADVFQPRLYLFGRKQVAPGLSRCHCSRDGDWLCRYGCHVHDSKLDSRGRDGRRH
ncbi:uncharacterized protein TrAtP1_006131 [Trichoderma atroviride]|uniref:uncharacterized protein n=1 Tax=Hypocrea atroviridis TaxID=63577 RepID=UPI00331E77AC|nr:hypothetical protein TrAtP1_006131 [Trichoderma atroviride]